MCSSDANADISCAWISAQARKEAAEEVTGKVNLTDNNNCVIPGPGAEVGMLEMIKIHVLSCAIELFNTLLHVVIRDNGKKLIYAKRK